MKKAFYAVFAVYALIYCTVLAKYIFPSYDNVGYFWYIPYLLLLTIILVTCFPKTLRFFNKVANLKVWMIASITIMATCTALQLAGIAGYWGSIPTIGLVPALLTLGMCLVNSKIILGKGLLLSIGCLWIGEGVSELTYKIGFIIYRDYPGGSAAFVSDIPKVLVWIGIGVLALLIIGKGTEVVRFNPTFYAFAALAVFSTAMLFLTGFKTAHYLNGSEVLMPMLSRLWKASTLFAPIMLLVKERRTQCVTIQGI